MTSQGRADLVRQYFAAIDNRKFDLLQDMLGPEYTLHFAGTPAMNTEAAVAFLAEFIAAFPDIQHTIHDLLVDGDRAAARIQVQGTHEGAFMGIPPTGSSMAVPGINIFRFDAGKLAEQWIGADSLGMLQQLGAFPPAG